MSGPRVKLNQGELQGKTNITSNGFKYNCFQGIPYGKPPIGELRFKDPLPADKWIGIRDGTKEGNVCPQIDPFQGGAMEGDEDCLYLNVYAPEQIDTSNPLPVMVWIHGGGFYKGSGNYSHYGPDFIIDKNVVYVSINYRFAVLGFFCLDTPGVPGNAGLKDQVLALKWIQGNIKYFGGDPNNVTLFGESAGAVSIHYLCLSANAQSLFHKAIIQSGSSLCHWALQSDPVPYAFKLAAALGHDICDVEKVLVFLQKEPLTNLLKVASKIISEEDSRRYLPCAFLPVVEKKFDGIQSILNDKPENIITSGNFKSIPIIAGYSSKESVFMFEKVACDPKRVFEFIVDFKYFIPSKLDVKDGSAEANEVAKAIREFYFKDKEIGCDTVHNVIDMISDYLFRHSMDLTVKLLAKHSRTPVYYYQFSYFGNLNRYKNNMTKLKVTGAAHSEENDYIFRKQSLDSIELQKSDNLVRQRLVQMWTNFAKNGDPTPSITDVISAIWKPVTANDTNYIEIDENLTPGINPNAEALSFWMNLRDGKIPVELSLN